MSQSFSDRFSLKHALGLSTVLHVLVAPLFVVSSVVLVGAGQSAEPLGFRSGAVTTVTMMTIEHRTRHPAVHAQAIRPTPSQRLAPKRELPKARRSASVDTPAQSVAGAPSTRGQVAASEGSAVLSVVREPIVTQPVEAATLAPKVESAPTAAPTSGAAPPSQPAVTVALASSMQSAAGHGYDAPNGGWGQNFERPLIADEVPLNDLRAKYHFSATITVNVDETGHATRVTFPNSIPAEARPDIEKRLTALRYVPAECNGLRCAAALAIPI